MNQTLPPFPSRQCLPNWGKPICRLGARPRHVGQGLPRDSACVALRHQWQPSAVPCKAGLVPRERVRLCGRHFRLADPEISAGMQHIQRNDRHDNQRGKPASAGKTWQARVAPCRKHRPGRAFVLCRLDVVKADPSSDCKDLEQEGPVFH